MLINKRHEIACFSRVNADWSMIYFTGNGISLVVEIKKAHISFSCLYILPNKSKMMERKYILIQLNLVGVV